MFRTGRREEAALVCGCIDLSGHTPDGLLGQLPSAQLQQDEIARERRTEDHIDAAEYDATRREEHDGLPRSRDLILPRAGTAAPCRGGGHVGTSLQTRVFL